MSVYKNLYDLIEMAIFQYQAKDVNEIIRFIRDNSTLRSLDPREIDRITYKVCTSYQKEQSE